MSALIPYRTTTVELEVDAGIGMQVDRGVWDSGTWGASVWGQTDTTLGDWVDITCDVLDVTINSGASTPDGVITRVDATTGAVTLAGEQWNPWGATYRGLLGPRVPLRGRWRKPGDTTWHAMFTGATTGWPYDRVSKQAALSFVDSTAYLSNYVMQPETVPVAQESTSARVNRTLDKAQWSATARDIPAGGVQVIPSVLDGDPWAQLQLLADSNLGIVWLSRAGVVTFRAIAQAGQSGAQPLPHQPWRLTDVDDGNDATDVCVVNYVRTDPIVMRNDVAISHAPLPVDNPPAVPVVRLTNDASIQRYYSFTYSRTDLLHADDVWSASLASMILNSGAWPVNQPQSAELDVLVDARVADLLLSAEVGTLIDVQDSGEWFTCLLAGYSVELTRDTLTGTLVLESLAQWTAGNWDAAHWGTDRWGV